VPSEVPQGGESWARDWQLSRWDSHRLASGDLARHTFLREKWNLVRLWPTMTEVGIHSERVNVLLSGSRKMSER
jgi:hypothetical protein